MTVCQDAPRPSATRAMDSRSMTTDLSAQSTAARVSFDRGAAAAVVSWRHTWAHPRHRERRTVTSRTVGRHPTETCASRRSTVSRGMPSSPHRVHQQDRSVTSSGSTTRHAGGVAARRAVRRLRSPQRAVEPSSRQRRPPKSRRRPKPATRASGSVARSIGGLGGRCASPRLGQVRAPAPSPRRSHTCSRPGTRSCASTSRRPLVTRGPIPAVSPRAADPYDCCIVGRSVRARRTASVPWRRGSVSAGRASRRGAPPPRCAAARAGPRR